MVNEGNNLLQQRMTKTVDYLRRKYYEYHGEECKEDFFALGGKATESIGPFVEFNLRGKHCRHSEKGHCVPCFYSRFPSVLGINDYSDVLIVQIDNIIDDFQRTTVNKGNGEFAYKKDDLHYKNDKPIPLCITPVGSFFDEREFSPKARQYLLERLLQKSDELKRDIFLYIETHASDFNLIVNNLSNREKELFSRLHLRIVLGFESYDDFVRNILYNKNVNIKDFEDAVKKAKFLGYGTYAFVFAGLFPLTVKETVSDVTNSLLYLKKINVAPILMFANYQEYTIGDLLVRHEKENPLSPITVLELIRIMLTTTADQASCQDDWLMADPVGGPPDPDMHIFSDSKKNWDCDCGDLIYNLIKDLREKRNNTVFDIVFQKILSCKVHGVEYQRIKLDIETSLPKRTEEMLDFVDEHKELYCQELRRREVLIAKANLLCNGVRLDGKAKEELLRIGISDGFVHSTNLTIDGEPINACVIESFSDDQEYLIRFDDSRFFLFHEPPMKEHDIFPQSSFIGEVNFLEIPAWGDKIVDGLKISDYLRPHSNHCISIWPNQNCFPQNDRCAFCSLSNDTTLLPETVLKMVSEALVSERRYEIHLGGGLYKNFEKNIEYYSSIAGLIYQQFPNCQISLETVPPIDRNGLLTYKKNGISSIIMNLEIAVEGLRREICPGKAVISKDRYFEAYREAVEIFGKWNVGSVLIWGIEGQKKEDICMCAKEMCSIGVMPILMPFQPLKGCILSNKSQTKADAYIDVAEEVARIISSNKKPNEHFCDYGCIKCGACSLEKDLINMFYDKNMIPIIKGDCNGK